MRTIITLLIISTFYTLICTGQPHQYKMLNTIPEFDSTQTKQLSFRVENANFFRNNEYYSPILDGYTYIGLWSRLLMAYYPAQNVRVRAGAHLLKYHGKSSFDPSESIPYFSITYQPKPGFNVTLGNINNDQNFGMPAMLYEPEYFYAQSPPAGAMVTYNKKWFDFETWIDWETFIYEGDPFQEKFTNGSKLLFRFINNNQINFRVPVYFVYHHQGGEIDSSAQKIETLMNGATGIDFTYKAGAWTMGIESLYVGYREATSNYLQPFRAGHGAVSRGFLSYKTAGLSLGYWQGKRFIAPRGRRIYQSVSFNTPGITLPKRQLIEGRLSWKIQIKKGIHFALESDAFFDLNDNSLSYAWGIHLFFNESFFLKKFD